MSTLRLSSTLSDTSPQSPRVSGSSISRRLGGIRAAENSETLPTRSAIVLVVLRRAEGRLAACSGSCAGSRGGSQTPFVEEVDDDGRGVHVVISLVRPGVTHVVDGVVRVDTFQLPAAPFHFLHVVVVQIGLGEAAGKAVALRPGRHEIWNIRETAVAALATAVRDRLVFCAVEFQDGHVLSAWVAGDRDGQGLAVGV